MKRREFLAASIAASGVVMGLQVNAQETSAASSEGASTNLETALANIASLIEEQMSIYDIPGVSLGVLKDGTPHILSFGITSVEDPLPVDENTTFEIASLSKTVTATAIMHLVEAGLLDLDTPVRTYLPDWRVADEGVSQEMLVRHLISHSTGLNGPASTEDLGLETLERFAASMDRLVPVASPGTQWSYLNPGYALAGRLIEVSTGSDIHTAFNEIIFKPLGLERTTTRLDLLATWRMALGHRPSDEGGLEIVRPYSMGSSIPAGGVNMSMDNMLRYAAFHLGQSGSEHDQVLSLAGRQLMREPQIVKAPTDDEMSLGWHLRTVGGIPTFAHGGSAGAGHRLLLELVPDRNLAFAIFTNHTEGWRLAQIVEHAVLREIEGLSLELNQLITYRGANEDFTLHATPLEVQPDASVYLGSYDRGESDPIEVRVEGDQILVDDDILYFYGNDVAYRSTNGTPVEFIRDGDGVVNWIRVNGQGFARKQSS